MPYIPQEDREEFDYLGSGAWTRRPDTVGELNFAITMLCKRWLDRYGTSYATLNEVIGVLECVKLELYRRMAAPYEDRKRDQNGEVFA